MKKVISLSLALILVSLIIAGCGETLNGVSKDIKRVGKGIKTVFMREE